MRPRCHGRPAPPDSEEPQCRLQLSDCDGLANKCPAGASSRPSEQHIQALEEEREEGKEELQVEPQPREHHGPVDERLIDAYGGPAEMLTQASEGKEKLNLEGEEEGEEQRRFRLQLSNRDKPVSERLNDEFDPPIEDRTKDLKDFVDSLCQAIQAPSQPDA